MDKLTCVIPTLFGLEGIAAEELRRLGLTDVRAEDGRALCSAALADIPRINLNLRTGERVLIGLARFSATDFDTLFEGVRSIPWEEFLPKDAQFPVKGYSLNSQLHSVPACQGIVKRAAASRLASAYHMDPLPETGVLYQIQFSILRDTVTIMLDTSGEGLYKRGYRTDKVLAPLRETLAAGIVLLSRYRGKDLFCDPHCGSGTIPIEAALIARNRAPGLNRSFSSQRWPLISSSAWLDAADEALDKEYHGKYEIWGGDIDPNAVRIAKENAKRAEVEDIIRFQVADSTKFFRSESTGRIVTNPPYGERLLELSETEQLYKNIGKSWGKLDPGWQINVLSSHEGFEQLFGKPAAKKRKLYNGMIKCNLYMYQPIPGGKPQGRQAQAEKPKHTGKPSNGKYKSRKPGRYSS